MQASLVAVLALASFALGSYQGWGEKVTLIGSDTQAGDYFGSQISVSDNYIIAGASGYDDYRGGLYLFSLSGNNTWTQFPDIKKGEAPTFSFGKTLAVNDEYVIACDHNFNIGQGKAYLYSISANTWPEVNIILEGEAPQDGYCHDVSLSTNYILIGARLKDSRKGAAYVYTRVDGVWQSANTTLTASDGEADDYFGTTVAITNRHAIIGATSAGLCADGYCDGVVYTYSRRGRKWIQGPALTNESTWTRLGSYISLSDCFAVIADSAPSFHIYSLSGDGWEFMKRVDGYDYVSASGNYIISENKMWYYNGDDWVSLPDLDAAYTGGPTVITEKVAAMGASWSNPMAGVTVFRNPITPNRTVCQAPPSDIIRYDSDRSGLLGSGVALIQDTLIITQPKCLDMNNCDGGRAYIFIKNEDGEFEVVQILKGRHRNSDAMFGSSITINDRWLAITSKGTSYNTTPTAMVNIFQQNPDTGRVERIAGLRPKSNIQADMDFGRSIALTQNDAVVGAPKLNGANDLDIGAVMGFRFRVSVNRWGRHPSVTTAYDAVAGDQFGHSVAIDNSFLAVGNNPADDTRHAVYILTKTGYNFAHYYKISGNGKKGFGWSVLLVSDELVVSSPQDENNGGSVTVFAKNSTNRFEEYTTITHPFFAERRFGYAVARVANRMAIGTNTCPTGSQCTVQGEAFLYVKRGQQWVSVRSFSSDADDGSDGYGTHVAIDGDDMIVSAPESDNQKGVVHVYYDAI